MQASMGSLADLTSSAAPQSGSAANAGVATGTAMKASAAPMSSDLNISVPVFLSTVHGVWSRHAGPATTIRRFWGSLFAERNGGRQCAGIEPGGSRVLLEAVGQDLHRSKPGLRVVVVLEEDRIAGVRQGILKFIERLAADVLNAFGDHGDIFLLATRPGDGVGKDGVMELRQRERF